MLPTPPANREQIDAGFDRVRTELFLRAHLADARDPGFWSALNPHLTISERPIAPAAGRVPVEPAVASRAARQIVEEGYLLTPPLLPPARIDALRCAMERVVEAGFPSGFVCVYDEYYQAFQGLDELFAPLLGERYLMVLHGVWGYCIPAGDPAYSEWGAAEPHRDSMGPDPRVIAGETPSILNVWIPITDVAPSDSCIYAVPAPGDPDYHTADRRVRAERFRLQDIRALAAPAGSVIAWSTHLVHWGSRSSVFAAGPRMSVTLYLQRRDVPAVHPTTRELDAALPFDERLAMVGRWLGVADLWNHA